MSRRARRVDSLPHRRVARRDWGLVRPWGYWRSWAARAWTDDESTRHDMSFRVGQSHDLAHVFDRVDDALAGLQQRSPPWPGRGWTPWTPVNDWPPCRRSPPPTANWPAVENQLITGLQREATHAELGDGLTSTLARVTRITTPEANRRIRDAEDTATRTAITGEPLPPRFPATAAAVAAGTLDRSPRPRDPPLLPQALPANIPADERDRAEQVPRRHRHPAATRRTPRSRRPTAGLHGPRGRLHRDRPSPPPGLHLEPPGLRRHEQGRPVGHPRAARRTRRHAGRLGRPRQMQPQRRKPLRRRRTRPSGRRTRYPRPGPAPPRRTLGGGARDAGLRTTRSPTTGFR